MFKMTGLDKLMKQLQQVTEAFEDDDGRLGTLSFDPHDPASIEMAIVEMETLVDQRTSAFPGNPLLENLGEQMKERYRSAVVERAALSRASGELPNIGED